MLNISSETGTKIELKNGLGFSKDGLGLTKKKDYFAHSDHKNKRTINSLARLPSMQQQELFRPMLCTVPKKVLKFTNLNSRSYNLLEGYRYKVHVQII